MRRLIINLLGLCLCLPLVLRCYFLFFQCTSLVGNRTCKSKANKFVESASNHVSSCFIQIWNFRKSQNSENLVYIPKRVFTLTLRNGQIETEEEKSRRTGQLDHYFDNFLFLFYESTAINTDIWNVTRGPIQIIVEKLQFIQGNIVITVQTY